MLVESGLMLCGRRQYVDKSECTFSCLGLCRQCSVVSLRCRTKLVFEQSNILCFCEGTCMVCLLGSNTGHPGFVAERGGDSFSSISYPAQSSSGLFMKWLASVAVGEV